KSTEGNDQTKQKQQMIGPLENVVEAEFDESCCGLIPVRVETNHTRVAEKLEGSCYSCRGQESQDRDDSQTKTLERRMNREIRAIGLNRILEQHIEHPLIPVQVDVVGKPRPGDMRQRLLIACERFVRLQ